MIRLNCLSKNGYNKGLDEAYKWENIARKLAEKQGLDIKEKGEKI